MLPKEVRARETSSKFFGTARGFACARELDRRHVIVTRFFSYFSLLDAAWLVSKAIRCPPLLKSAVVIPSSLPSQQIVRMPSADLPAHGYRQRPQLERRPIHQNVVGSVGICGHPVVKSATREHYKVSTIRDDDFSSMPARGIGQLQFEQSGVIQLRDAAAGY